MRVDFQDGVHGVVNLIQFLALWTVVRNNRTVFKYWSDDGSMGNSVSRKASTVHKRYNLQDTASGTINDY